MVPENKKIRKNKQVTGSERSRKLLLILSMVLRRVRISVRYVGQWRRYCAINSITKPQLQNGFRVFWKLCSNLCPCKWFRPSRSLVINLIPLGFWLLKKLLADGLINFRILFPKILKLLEFLMLWSSLFHSMVVDGKKEFLRIVYICLAFKESDIMHISSNITRPSCGD